MDPDLVRVSFRSPAPSGLGAQCFLGIHPHAGHALGCQLDAEPRDAQTEGSWYRKNESSIESTGFERLIPATSYSDMSKLRWPLGPWLTFQSQKRGTGSDCRPTGLQHWPEGRGPGDRGCGAEAGPLFAGWNRQLVPSEGAAWLDLTLDPQLVPKLGTCRYYNTTNRCL